MKQVLLVALLSCTAASATQIMFPSYVFGKAGDRVTVSVGISGVDAPSGLGGFHLDFRWNNDQVWLVGYTAIYTGAIGPAMVVETYYAPDGYEISVVSLLPPDELVGAQRLDLALLVMTFELGLGYEYCYYYPERCDPNKERYAFLRISGELTDGLGNPIDTTFVGPEPGTGVALALGAAFLGLRSYRRRRT